MEKEIKGALSPASAKDTKGARSPAVVDGTERDPHSDHGERDKRGAQPTREIGTNGVHSPDVEK